jgi:4-amino-4-deoxy-L-arabinose transferase-like glycosyltransferase
MASHDDAAARTPRSIAARLFSPLALILVVAAALRVWAIRHGLPYAYNLDERAHFVPHAVTMTAGDLNPGYFVNPPAFTYLTAGLLKVLGYGEREFATHPDHVFLAGRALSAALGVATVAATYFAGRAWFGRGVGLLAAAVMAVAFLPVSYSRLALNDGPAVLPCALGLWAAAAIFRSGSLRAFAAGGACVGLAAGAKYSDGVIVVALAAAALVSPAVGTRRTLAGLALVGAVAVAVFLATNPYALLDLHTFLHDIERQRKYASGTPLIGQVERNGWWYYASSLSWALGIVPALAALVGLAVLALRRRREAVVLGALVLLFWLYMGSQHRFYARWMLPVYPALALLAGYAAMQVRVRRLPAALTVGAAAALLIVPALVPTVRNARVMSRLNTVTETRAWLAARLPAGAKVVFEPIAPREWYGRTPGGGPLADRRRQWTRFNRNAAMIRELARTYRGARGRADFQNYELTLTPALVGLYRRLGYCWVVSGSTQSGRALAEPGRAPHALAYYRGLRAESEVAFAASPLRAGAKLPRYQVDRSFNFVDSAYARPGPVMVVYRLRDCA